MLLFVCLLACFVCLLFAYLFVGLVVCLTYLFVFGAVVDAAAVIGGCGLLQVLVSVVVVLVD